MCQVWAGYIIYISKIHLLLWYWRKDCMVKFWKKNEKIANVLKGLLVSYVVTGVLIMLLAFVLYKFALPERVVGIGIIIIYVISTFLGGFLLGKNMKVKKYLWGLLIGMSYFVVLMIVSLMVNGGFQNMAGNFFLTMILCGGSGMLGGMLS